MFIWNPRFYWANWLEIPDLQFTLSQEILQDECAMTRSRNYLDLVCQESISSCWNSAEALISLLEVSQNLLHWQESMKKTWRRVNCISAFCEFLYSCVDPFWVFVGCVCVCQWRGWDLGTLDWEQIVAKRLALTCWWHCCPFVRNKSYLCHAFTCDPGISASPKVSITENGLYEKRKKSPKVRSH